MVPGKTNVHVVYPDLEQLTARFCDGIRDFCDTVTSPLFAPFLRDRSTFENYYEYWDELYESDDAITDTDDPETAV